MSEAKNNPYERLYELHKRLE